MPMPSVPMSSVPMSSMPIAESPHGLGMIAIGGALLAVSLAGGSGTAALVLSLTGGR
ncbi:MAG: hypothetical protein ACT4O0_10485 [Pseudonocardia sp.]